MAARWPEPLDLVIVDHYGRDKRFESACRSWAQKILVFDDVPNRHHDCDVLIDPGSINAHDQYRTYVPSDCRLLLGPAYALLRRQFPAARGAALKRRRAEPGLHRILIFFGTGVPVTTAVHALQAIAQSAIDVAIDVIAASTAPQVKELRTLAEHMPQEVSVHTNVSDMAGLMAAADLAIGAPGSASWERACLGLPSVLAVLADNQRPNAAALERAGAAIVVEGNDLVSAIATVLRDLVANPQVRTDMAAKTARLCDGRGPARAMLAVLPVVHSRDGRPVTLRLVCEDDAERLFTWQTHEPTRRYSRNPRIPTWNEHVAWLANALDDVDRWTLMVEHAGEPAGILRMDPRPDDRCHEVSILTAPEKYGRGIALAALELSRRFLPGHALRAHVHSENTASHRLFFSAGYRAVKPDEYINEGWSAADSSRQAVRD